MSKLSILIPARNEEFLKRTIEDILSNIEDDTEILVGLDGWLTDIPVDPRITVLYEKESIGQRAMTNKLARLSNSKYLMKLDAHCAMDKGFDRKMMEVMQDTWTQVPVMRNLHVFNWVCEEGHKRYQSPSGPCKECGKPTTKEIVWIPKTNPQSTSYCFDEEPHFQYFNQFKKRPEGKGELTESMSLQGSCFMVTREKYFELNLCDEWLGSWGSQGIEVACKTWLSGGRVIVNHNTWYAHLFRTQGGDFGFPYENEGSKSGDHKKKIRELFFDNKWDKQIYPLSWLLDKFAPVPGWTPEMQKKITEWPLPTKPLGSLTVGVLYYTDNELEPGLAERVRNQILKGIKDYKLVSVTLKPLDFGHNIVLPLERGKLTMHKQILAGLEALDTDIVFFVEHDVFYHPSHFNFRPSNKDIYYYNMNLWRVRQSDGFAISYDHKSLSQLCAYRSKLLPEYRERVRRIEREGFNKNGYEPGTRSIRLGGFSNDRSEGWKSEYPNIDVRHTTNLSASKWRPEDFRSERSCRNWRETTVDKIEGWENLQKML
jgi:hypothetical protein